VEVIPILWQISADRGVLVQGDPQSRQPGSQLEWLLCHGAAAFKLQAVHSLSMVKLICYDVHCDNPIDTC
jgi:hypothetical protein